MKKFSVAVALLVLTAGPVWAGGNGNTPPFDQPFPVPVPEPATLGLIAGGALMLGAVAMFRRKKD